MGMAGRGIRELFNNEDISNIQSHLKRGRRRREMAPVRVRETLDHYREIRTRILDFSHTVIGQRILPSLHAWEQGTATIKQHERAEQSLDRLLRFVAWKQGVKAQALRDLIHEEMEAILPSESGTRKNNR